MWQVDPEITQKLIGDFWSAHVIDWSNLDFDRIGRYSYSIERPWNHEYKGGPTFFNTKTSGGLGQFHTTCDLTLTGEKPNDVFGELMDASGDVDGDNLCDLLTGVHYFSYTSDDQGRHDRGRAYLYYGGKPMDGVCDVVFTGENIGDEFGSGVEVTDIDNDGHADIFIAARTCSKFVGRVYLYWGKGKTNMSNHADLIFDGESNPSAFGGDDIAVGDINNDVSIP